MNEMTKTLVYGAIGLVFLGLAVITRPQQVKVEPDEQLGKPLFADFSDATAITSFRLVKRDENSNRATEFQVEKRDGRWSIPSHDNYPADAEDQMRDVATLFDGLNVKSVVSDRLADHVIYGVVEPDPNAARQEAEGVGILVSMKQTDNKAYQLIIGKEERKDASQQAETRHYVRIPGQDRVYSVAIDPKKLSTDFGNWIQKDLLDLNTWDIKQLTLKDYSMRNEGISPEGHFRIRPEFRFELSVSEDTSKGGWKVERFLEAKDGMNLQDSQLAAGEEPDKARLDGLRDALRDLKIVNVEPKPKGLGANLRADESFVNDQESVRSLIERGFYPLSQNDGSTEILSGNGEVLIHTKEGVEYVLRFGEIESVDQKENESKVNRYVMVSTRVTPGHFAEPNYEQVPEVPGEAAAPAASENATPAAPSAAPADTGAPAADPAASESAAAGTEPAAPPAENPDNGKSDDPETNPATPPTSADPAPPPTASSDPAKPAAPPAPAPTADPNSEMEKLKKERDRIVKENQRKQDEYNNNVQKAERKVRELNFRFANWYYVISEDVYKKIHLTRADAIKLSEASQKEGFNLDALRELEKQAK